MADDHPAQKDAPARQQMEVGGSGTAKASFADVLGADVKIASSVWTSTGPVTVTADAADPPDPTSATLAATAPGRAHVKVAVTSERGLPAEAAVEVMVIETGTPVEGKIELSLQPASAKAKPPSI